MPFLVASGAAVFIKSATAQSLLPIFFILDFDQHFGAADEA